MSCLPALPPEIIRLVLLHLGHVSTMLQDYYGDGHEAYIKTASQVKAYASTRDLLSVCLVSKAWCREAQSILYSNINCARQELLYGSSAMQSRDYMETDSNLWDSSDSESVNDSIDAYQYTTEPVTAGPHSAWTDGTTAGLIEATHHAESRANRTSKKSAKDDEYSDNESVDGGSDGFAENTGLAVQKDEEGDRDSAIEDDNDDDGSSEEEAYEACWDEDELDNRGEEEEEVEAVDLNENEEEEEEEEEEEYNSDHGSGCDCPEMSWRRKTNNRLPIVDISPSDSIAERLKMLHRSLRASPGLASYVKTFSYEPATDDVTSTLALCTQVVEICFVYQSGSLLPTGFSKAILKLQKLQRCQLFEFPVATMHRILAAVSRCSSLRILRLSSILWDRDDEDEAHDDDEGIDENEVEERALYKEEITDLTNIRPYSFENVQELLIDNACLSTANFSALMSHFHLESGTQKLEIRLHGVSWAEVGNSYNPFGELSAAIKRSIIAYKLRESSLETSDFRDIEQLSALQTVGIFASNFEHGFNGNTVTFPPSITGIELGYNSISTRDGWVPVLTVVEAWVRAGKLPNLKMLTVKPGDFGWDGFESDCAYDTYDACSAGIASKREMVQSFQEMLDAFRVDCNIRPMSDFERFINHINRLFNFSQPWQGLLVERLDALEDTGPGYEPWRG